MYRSKSAKRNLPVKKAYYIFVILYVYVLTRTKNTTLYSKKTFTNILKT